MEQEKIYDIAGVLIGDMYNAEVIHITGTKKQILEYIEKENLAINMIYMKDDKSGKLKKVKFEEFLKELKA